MENLYLILHKVRGEPEFDVAQCCDDMGTERDPGPWWIIPTSGHRAYPAKSWLVTAINEEGFLPEIIRAIRYPEEETKDPKWADLRDHYTCFREPSSVKKSLASLLSVVKRTPRLRIRGLP